MYRLYTIGVTPDLCEPSPLFVAYLRLFSMFTCKSGRFSFCRTSAKKEGTAERGASSLGRPAVRRTHMKTQAGKAAGSSLIAKINCYLYQKILAITHITF